MKLAINTFKINSVLQDVMINIHISRVKQIMYVFNHVNQHHSFLVMELTALKTVVIMFG